MCGPNFCSMKITQDVREYAQKQGIADLDKAMEQGMQDKSEQFKQSGLHIYAKK